MQDTTTTNNNTFATSEIEHAVDGSSQPLLNNQLDGLTNPNLSQNLDPLANSQHNTLITLQNHISDFLTVGGPVVWILMAMSIIAFTIVLLKIMQFWSAKPERTSGIDRSLELWKQGDFIVAKTLLNPKYSVESLTIEAMKGITSNQAEPILREELRRLATYKLNQLRSYLRPLEIIATLSPLLGLLGTVLGMIVAFQQMEGAGSQVDPSVLSGGIWQALLTTAVGLSVAIPVVIAHSWCERKVERVSALMNDTVTQLFTHQFANLKIVKAKKEMGNAA